MCSILLLLSQHHIDCDVVKGSSLQEAVGVEPQDFHRHLRSSHHTLGLDSPRSLQADNYNYCGTSYDDAKDCQNSCYGGLDSECPSSETCYAQVTTCPIVPASTIDDFSVTTSPDSPIKIEPEEMKGATLSVTASLKEGQSLCAVCDGTVDSDSKCAKRIATHNCVNKLFPSDNF